MNDLTCLSHLDLDIVTSQVHDRFQKDQCYTWISQSILLAVNPYKKIPGTFHLPSDITGPHLYTLVQKVLESSGKGSKNCTIVCSGESSSGKTVSTKEILRYLCFHCGDNQVIRDGILASNPILEAFGNAKTLRNGNSSRFAKFIKVHLQEFSKNQGGSKLTGCTIDTFLLEKSRVVHCSTGERNYHIFYYIAQEYLQGKHQFQWLPREKDPQFESSLSVLSTQLTSFHFTDLDALFRVLAGILFLGERNAKKVGELWGLPLDTLDTFLTIRNIYVNKEVVKKKYTEAEEGVNRESLATTVYVTLFQFIVAGMNQSLSTTHTQELSPWIGILDLFGFECFTVNSFEQFCINWANEKLQCLFNHSILLSEQEEYKTEAIIWKPVPFVSNQPTLDLLEGHPSGVVSLLNSVCMLQGTQSSPSLFLDNLITVHGKHPRFKGQSGKRVIKGTARSFTILHYACPVQYDVTHFLDKNRVTRNVDLEKMLVTSSNPWIQRLFPRDTKTDTITRGTFTSVARLFSQQLSTLIQTIGQTKCYFVKCINPNSLSKKDHFHVDYVTPQVQCGGIVEAIQVLSVGYPCRIPYSILTGNLLDRHTARNVAEGMCRYLGVKKYQLGLRKLFFPTGSESTVHGLLTLEHTPTVTQFLKKWVTTRRTKRVVTSVKCLVHVYREIRHLRMIRKWRRLVALLSLIHKRVIGKLRKLRRKKRSIQRLNTGAPPTLIHPEIDLDDQPPPLIFLKKGPRLEENHHNHELHQQELATWKQKVDQVTREWQQLALDRELAFQEREKQTTVEWEQKLDQQVQELVQREQDKTLELARVTKELDKITRDIQREKKEWFQTARLESVQERQSLESQLTSTQEMISTLRHQLTRKDEIIQRLEHTVRRLENEKSTSAHQFNSIEKKYLKRIQELERRCSSRCSSVVTDS
jgi:myosin heavy subunit